MLPGQAQLPYACAGTMETYGVQGIPNSLFEWVVDGGSLVDSIYNMNNDTIVIRWDYNRGTHNITVTEHTEFGCSGIPMAAEIEINAPIADIGDEAEVCEDTTYTFIATTTYHTDVTYLWNDGSTDNSYAAANEGYVWVRVTGTDQCVDYDSAFLTLNALPDIYLGPDTTLCGTELLTIDPGFFSEYEWSTGDISPTITVDGGRMEPELISITVTDENGCRASDTMMIEVCDATLLFANMPNTITPSDKNGQNDEWEIPNIEIFPQAVLEIYDRWGRLVYVTNDIYHNPWKGTNMKGVELPMDAYYFVLDLKIAHVKAITGYVNVIR
jgi:gliding motility-associated-like protein